ncbi:MAG: dihydroneopterin aldolase [Legionellales bacterium RIFCSPHIGHO2_12_FULL_37_14]|nr:MAG: dihydroneopterin aldolase [Legionellales bacterium RIFCSPHIGHO2_12_FULL_37_14]
MEYDWIEIHNLKVITYIGIHAWERRVEQSLILDIACGINLPPKVTELKDTLDYTFLSEAVTEFIKTQSFQLIETLAQQLLQFIVEKFNVKAVTLKVTKPNALDKAKGASVMLNRTL